MLFRVRTTMSDRPGSLAALARHCGEQGVNILGLQIFPGVAGVTDELVLRAPTSWGIGDVAGLIEERRRQPVTVGTLHRARPRGRADPVPPRPAPAGPRPGHAWPSAGPAARRRRRPCRRSVDLSAVQDTLVVAVGARTRWCCAVRPRSPPPSTPAPSPSPRWPPSWSVRPLGPWYDQPAADVARPTSSGGAEVRLATFDDTRP